MLPAELIAQGRQTRKENKLSAARGFYAQAATLYREQNDSLAYAHTIRHIADMHLDESHLAEAKPLYEESLEIYRANLDTKLLDLANTVRPYALIHERQGNLELAAQLWQEAKVLYASLRIEVAVCECDTHLAQTSQAQIFPG